MSKFQQLWPTTVSGRVLQMKTVIDYQNCRGMLQQEVELFHCSTAAPLLFLPLPRLLRNSNFQNFAACKICCQLSPSCHLKPKTGTIKPGKWSEEFAFGRSLVHWEPCVHPQHLPIIRSAAVKCDEGGPARLVVPRAAPLIAHATPPSATTAISARTGGPANHLPQHPFPDRSDGDL